MFNRTKNRYKGPNKVHSEFNLHCKDNWIHRGSNFNKISRYTLNLPENSKKLEVRTVWKRCNILNKVFNNRQSTT